MRFDFQVDGCLGPSCQRDLESSAYTFLEILRGKSLGSCNSVDDDEEEDRGSCRVTLALCLVGSGLIL